MSLLASRDETILGHAVLDREVGGQPQSVDARSLHAFLEVGKDFSTWMKDRIDQYDFQRGNDYELFDSPNLGNQTRGGNRRGKEYAISLDMAKELCMVERNERGKQARRYFIAMEKRALSAPRVPQSLPEALRLAAQLAERTEEQATLIEELTPKAEAYEEIERTVTLHAAAKAVGTGPIRLKTWMRWHGIWHGGKPLDEFIDRGLFRVIEGSAGGTRSREVLVTEEGMEWLRGIFTVEAKDGIYSHGH